MALIEKGVPSSGMSTYTHLPVLASLYNAVSFSKLAFEFVPLNKSVYFTQDKSNGLDGSKKSRDLMQFVSGTPE